MTIGRRYIGPLIGLVRWEICQYFGRTQRIVCFFYKDNNGTVDLLIKYGANVNAVNSDGDTALHFAAMNGNLIMTIE